MNVQEQADHGTPPTDQHVWAEHSQEWVIPPNDQTIRVIEKPCGYHGHQGQWHPWTAFHRDPRNKVSGLQSYCVDAYKQIRKSQREAAVATETKNLDTAVQAATDKKRMPPAEQPVFPVIQNEPDTADVQTKEVREAGVDQLHHVLVERVGSILADPIHTLIVSLAETGAPGARIAELEARQDDLRKQAESVLSDMKAAEQLLAETNAALDAERAARIAENQAWEEERAKHEELIGRIRAYYGMLEESIGLRIPDRYRLDT